MYNNHFNFDLMFPKVNYSFHKRPVCFTCYLQLSHVSRIQITVIVKTKFASAQKISRSLVISFATRNLALAPPRLLFVVVMAPASNT